MFRFSRFTFRVPHCRPPLVHIRRFSRKGHLSVVCTNQGGRSTPLGTLHNRSSLQVDSNLSTQQLLPTSTSVGDGSCMVLMSEGLPFVLVYQSTYKIRVAR